MRALLREPLVHFVALGAVLFAVDALREDGAERAPDRIVVSEVVRADLVEQWEQSRGAPPDEAELERLVERWIDEEVLYREGLARGLGRDDPAVRARVVSQMAFVLEEQVAAPPPTEAELREWYEAHLDELSHDARVSFTHVFVDGSGDAARARAEEMLALVRGGAAPAGLGDRFPGGRRYRERELEQLEQAFGEDFVRGLDEQPTGEWHLRSSRYGLHVLRVDERDAGGTPSFEDVKERVREEVMAEREAALVEARVRALRDAYAIEGAP